ncbi:hypothetical protein [Sphingobium sp.]|uniref:hypothetical protein n=1 Tax=Sphingobium sp. TaxID=1912891 RepID=UPI0035C770CA
MLRRGVLFLCLLMSSLVAAATVHAQERPNAPTIECSGVVHSEGDADQSTGDRDSLMPHHHGSCHGGSACLPVVADGSGPPDLLSDAAPFDAAPVLARWQTGPDLRPPIA